MTYIAMPKFRHPKLPVNDLGFTKSKYEGALSTLCAGCGHDSISSAIIQACHEMSIPPHKIAKLSGIGCSSKTPAYYLGKSHGFNSVHGRMPSVATGANAANRDMIYLGMSGDGDTASIGFGNFAHVARRRLNMTYIVANNGTYGLTKGQTSATADRGSRVRKGSVNPWEGIDLTAIAIQLGASFVARSFSGDKEQLVPLIQAAISHKGFSFIDCISPCVTFNNHQESTKGFDYVREHNQAMNSTDYIPHQNEITTEYAEGESVEVDLHDGSTMRLRKLENHFDPSNKRAVLDRMNEAKEKAEILTGLLYFEKDSDDLHQIIGTVDEPLNGLDQELLCPGNEVLTSINASLR
ncbi:MAG: 2-oxoglutarate ferredoxin oxidoreductase subunit beta [Gammaproteobacteria bacterium]|nr:MAG: 2-oxoglutarate ferredoxin oxidoreductase subunit beta [Gammaproteobacteria bacterium]